MAGGGGKAPLCWLIVLLGYSETMHYWFYVIPFSWLDKTVQMFFVCLHVFIYSHWITIFLFQTSKNLNRDIRTLLCIFCQMCYYLKSYIANISNVTQLMPNKLDLRGECFIFVCMYKRGSKSVFCLICL